MNAPDGYDLIGASLATGVIVAALWLLFGGDFNDAARAVSLYARL